MLYLCFLLFYIFYITHCCLFNIVELSTEVFTVITCFGMTLAHQPGPSPPPTAVRQRPLQDLPLLHVPRWPPVGRRPLISPVRFPELKVLRVKRLRQILNNRLLLLESSALSCHLSEKIP